MSDSKLKTLWIVAPCYFDVLSFMRLRIEIKSAVKSEFADSDIKFVLVDDSAGLDARLTDIDGLSDVMIFTPSYNLGHQRAIVYGLRKIQGYVQDEDIVVTLDSDGEDRPEDILRLVDKLKSSGAADLIVIARRTKRKVSIKFRLMYLGFVTLFRLLTGQILRSGNFALMPGQTLKRIVHHPNFDLCYSSTLVNVKIPALMVPCERGARYFDISKMGYFNLVMHGFRMLTPFMDRIAMRAIIFASFVAFVSFAGLIGLLIAMFGFDKPIQGWHIFACLLVFLVSFLSQSLFMLLFTVFNQLQGIGLQRIDQTNTQRKPTSNQKNPAAFL